MSVGSFQSFGVLLKKHVHCASTSQNEKYQPNFKTIRSSEPYVDANKAFDGNSGVTCGTAMTA